MSRIHLIRRALLMGGAAAFVPFATEYTTPGTQTISIPAGATNVTIEGISGGGIGSPGGGGDNNIGGVGGGYSKKNSFSVSGYTGIWISVPASDNSAVARRDTSGGTLLMNATKPSNSTNGTGDVKYDGGAGGSVAPGNTAAGGGAAGPSGNGGAASGSTPGVGNGSPAGDGSNNVGVAGGNYGGGGATDNTTNGAGGSGWIKLSWT